MARMTGHYIRHNIGGEEVAAFIPDALPPGRPPLKLNRATRELLRVAEHRLVRLELAGVMIPSLDWFIYAFVRKEAVLSSQIEGTQATLADLLAYEVGAPLDERSREVEVREICNYLDALAYARKQLARNDGLPLSIRLLNEAHRRLMKGVRGAGKLPGEIRRSQNWIGGTRPGNAAFVPPPPTEVGRLLSDLERFLHAEENGLPPVVRVGLVHVQFETIHPYLDGNGRIGRLLIALLLEHWKLLSAPALYLSLHFKRHRAEYYRRLAAVRLDGDWEGWITFFLTGVATIADEAVDTARELFSVVTRDRASLFAARGVSVAALRLLDQLPHHPVVTIPAAARLLETTLPTASKAVGVLERLHILVETTGRQRARVFHYRKYMELLRRETELEPSR
jgi:Fic family protein